MPSRKAPTAAAQAANSRDGQPQSPSGQRGLISVIPVQPFRVDNASPGSPQRLVSWLTDHTRLGGAGLLATPLSTVPPWLLESVGVGGRRGFCVCVFEQ